MLRAWAFVLGLALVVPGLTEGAQAQGQQATVRSPVLTIDSERMFNQSKFGQRVLADVQAQTEALAAENRRIEGELTDEEKSLTARRPGMTPEAFRTEANAFDTKVQGIRQAQDAKERALQQTISDGRDAFLTAARPVLGRLMLDRGAVVVLERRSIFLSVGVIDITDEAVAAIDAQVGDGTDTSIPEPPIPPGVETPGPDAPQEAPATPDPGTADPTLSAPDSGN